MREKQQSDYRTPLNMALRDIAAEYPREEKILITPDYRIGQQVLQGLAGSGTPWINFRMAAASALAHDSAEDKIIEGELRQVSGPGILAMIDDIFNRLHDAGKIKYFERHETNTGINHALTSVVMELRTKGIKPGAIKETVFVNKDKARDVKLILSEYEKFLERNSLIDKAGLTRLALESLKNKQHLPGRKYIIFARYYMSGIERDFINDLAGDDLIVIEDGQVFGLKAPKGLWESTPPGREKTCSSDIERLSWLYACEKSPPPKKDGTVQIFAAIGIRNEIREVFRRIVKENIPLDRVEIIYTDPETYGREIFCLAEKIGCPVTFSEGIPPSTIGPFRAIIGFLLWIKHDFTELYLRRMLESGDIRVEAFNMDRCEASAAAQLLRTSGTGWGRTRYENVLAKKEAEYRRRSEQPESEEEADLKEEYAAAANKFGALRNLCGKLLGLVPGFCEEDGVDVASLCSGCTEFLTEYARAESAVDSAFISEAVSRIKMIGRYGTGKLSLDEAVEKITGTVSTVKAGSSGPRPGHIHVSNYKHGGRTGRPNTFITGLDESRFPGRGLQDPVILDMERKRISPHMELSADKIRKNVYDMASMLAGLRGRVTASFAAFDVKEERNVFPAAILLQLYRLKEGCPGADYDEMMRNIGSPASTAAACDSGPALDLTEWWVSRLTENGTVKNAIESVKDIYPGIRAGLKAEEARESCAFTEYDGKVSPSGDELDPRENSAMVLSCSRIQTAAACPYKYFLSSVLKIEKPEETIKDPAAWLDPKEKGTLLHAVFEAFTRELRKSRTELSGEDHKGLAMGIFNRLAESYRDRIPPPNEVVYEGECIQMKRDIEIFLGINKALGTAAIYEELAFGTGSAPPVNIPLGNGKKIKLRGIIDRVDNAGPHEYHVWDYKTGSAYAYETKQYIKGGEMIQHALYAAAAEIILRESGEDTAPSITRTGYLLTSEKGFGEGKGSIFSRDPSRKDIWQKAMNILMDIIAGGGFYIANSGNCSFCDYAVICGDDKTKKRAKIKKGSGDSLLELWNDLKNYE